MTDEEINAVVSELLRERFKPFGFQGATVESQEDFDGSPIIRVTAHLNESNVPSERFTEALHAIRSNLTSRGEERFVFLDSMSPEDLVVDEDVE